MKRILHVFTVGYHAYIIGFLNLVQRYIDSSAFRNEEQDKQFRHKSTDQEPGPPRLIVRGDDMGSSRSANEAIVRCFEEGIETSIEVMVPPPWFPEAVAMLARIPTADVGIHLTLTSEWENVKWRPLSDCPSLQDANGYFYPMVQPNIHYPKQSLVENNWKLADIEKEFRVQIEVAQEHIPRISHVSGHMYCTSMNKDVRALVRRLCQEYNLGHSDDSLRAKGVRFVGFAGAHTTLDEKVDSFEKMLGKLKPGKTYMFIEHPGLDTPEARAIHHKGYENVAADRQGITDLWTHPRIQALITQKGIQLISYSQLDLQ
ncbi:polysaccharide deacetylase family protein [Spirosoma fluminis]